MTEKTILYLNVRKTVHEARAALLAAKRLGYRVILVSDTPVLPCLQGYIDHNVVTNTYDIDQSLATIDDLCKQYLINGVITWGDRDVELMAKVSQRYGLKGPSITAAKNARNKYQMRCALETVNDLLPRYHRVVDMASLNQAINYVGFPAVIKPTGGSGSKGIFVVYNNKEAKKAFSSLQEITHPNRDKIFSYYGGELIFEQYLDGNEFSVEGFIYNHNVTIIGIVDKKTTVNYHIEYQHVFPSLQHYQHQQAIFDHAKKIVKTLKLNNCAFHMEAKWTSNGFKLVEVAARIGGDYITSHLIPMATTVNLYEQILKISVGESPCSHFHTIQYAGMRSILATNSGKLTAISNIDTALVHPNVCHIFQNQKIGHEIQLPPVHFGQLRVASIIVASPSGQEILTTLDEIINRCQVVTASKKITENVSC